MEKPRKTNYAAIVEMARTEGWKELESMLMYDVKFSTSLLTRPRPKKITEGSSIISEMEWVVDPHETGRARGIFATASKYLDKVRSAKEHYNKNQGE